MGELFAADGRVQSLERLAQGDTAVHRLHPGVKLAVTLCYLVAVISCPPYDAGRLAPFFFYPALFMALSDTPYGPLLRRLAAALPFSLAGGIFNMIYRPDIAFTLWGVGVSYGALSCAVILTKTLLTVMAVLLLIATTTMNDLCGQLVRMKIPPVFVLALMLTYRYISVVLREAGRMYVSYIVRAPGQRGIRMRHMGGLLGTLFLRSAGRAERVYAAMRCRGFRAESSFGAAAGALSPGEWLWGLLVCGAVVLLRFFNVSLLLGRLVF